MDGQIGVVMCFRLGFIVIFENRFYGMSDRSAMVLYRLINFLFKD